MITSFHYRRRSLKLLLVIFTVLTLNLSSGALAAPARAPLGATFTATVVAPTYRVVDITTTSEHPHVSVTNEDHIHTVPHGHESVTFSDHFHPGDEIGSSTAYENHTHTDVNVRVWSESVDHRHTDVSVRVWSESVDHTHSTTSYIPWSYSNVVVTESVHQHTWMAWEPYQTKCWIDEHWCDCELWRLVPVSADHTHWSSRVVTYSGENAVTTQFNHPHTVTRSEPVYTTSNHPHTVTMSEPVYTTSNHPHPYQVPIYGPPYNHPHPQTVVSNHDHFENHVHTTVLATPHTHTTVTPALVAGVPAPQNISSDNSNATYKMPNLALQPVVTVSAGNTVAGNETIVWPLNHDLPMGVRAGVSALPYALMPDGSVVQGLSATVNSIRYYGATRNSADISSLYNDAWLNTLASERTQVLATEPTLGSTIADPTQGTFRLILQGTVRLFFLANVTMIWADGTTATLDLPTMVDVRNATSGLSQ